MVSVALLSLPGIQHAYTLRQNALPCLCTPIHTLAYPASWLHAYDRSGDGGRGLGP